MKKLIFNVISFSSIIFLLVIFIGNIDLPDEYVCAKTNNTSYEKIAWNLNLINEHPERIKGSVLFFGPSLIQGGISDSLLIANNIKAINFGTNGGGKEVELFFLNKILKYKPKKVYLHLFKDKRRNLHPMTPLLYTPSSLLSVGQSINFSFIQYLFKRISFVLDYFIWSVFEGVEKKVSYSSYGSVNAEDSFSENEYSKIKKADTDDYFETFQLHNNDFRKTTELNRVGLYFNAIRSRRRVIDYFGNLDFIYNTSSQQKFAAIALELSKKNGVECTQLYMPLIADAKRTSNFDSTFYYTNELRNVVSLKNFNFLDKYEFWSDMTHLSKKGALEFTKELISQGIVKP
jgi:hypothetical protein